MAGVAATDLNVLLSEAVRLKASDLHWSSDESPVLRLAGDLRRLVDVPGVSADELIQQVRGCLPERLHDSLLVQREFDCAFEWRGQGRFRLHLYRHLRGVAVALRLIPLEVPRLDTLGLPEFVGTIAQFERGLVLVTGPTGSGKSTTLAALIELINREQGRHIITIEDPVEFIYCAKRSVIRQREVGVHTESFAAALRAGLREDPDVILVGELRDLETVQLALTAAETGHLVFATLHSAGAAKTIDRIIDVFPAQQQAQVRSMLADSLQVVISQNLIKTSSGSRTPNVEIVTGIPAVRTLIREAKTHQLAGVMQVSRAAGMCTFEMHRAGLGCGSTT
jgi:twitching motility protein PilT